ncbi:MAG: universal stress protein [Desulfobulbaceae bacterium]|jgi:nucleotide-binding universal stress UspA family protein|nr:universal stress protein [Desulfobulbaceae bacterium]
MFRKILVCVDPAHANPNLLSCAVSLKQVGAEEVVLAHVIVCESPGLEGMLRKQAWPELERRKRICEEAGFKAVVETPVGHPARALNDLAESRDVSVIITGTHGRGLFEAITLAGSPLGNVSAKLLHLTRRPVLLIPPAMGPGPEAPDLFAHILFPTDFSDAAEVALAYLETVIRTIRCPVTLLHVLSGSKAIPHPGRGLAELQDLDRKRLQRLKAWLENMGATVMNMDLVQGAPGEEIARKAKERGCSLILMGTRGKGITREILLGSVARHVARHAVQPVLFIPAFQQS